MNKQYKVDWDWTLNYSSHPTPPLPKIRTLESAGIIIDFIYQYTDVIFLDHLAVIMYPSPIIMKKFLGDGKYQNENRVGLLYCSQGPCIEPNKSKVPVFVPLQSLKSVWALIFAGDHWIQTEPNEEAASVCGLSVDRWDTAPGLVLVSPVVHQVHSLPEPPGGGHQSITQGEITTPWTNPNHY